VIRYFADTSNSETGRIARGYLNSLLRSRQLVRLLSVGAPLDLDGPWAPYAALLMTPLSPAFVNVVCCHPSRWSWTQRVAMPNLSSGGEVASVTHASGRVELYTRGVRNVLLTTEPPSWGQPGLDLMVADAMRYEALVVPTLELAAHWHRADCQARVVPVPVVDHQAFCEVVVPR
jgi:hypothetical protein